MKRSSQLSLQCASALLAMLMTGAMSLTGLSSAHAGARSESALQVAAWDVHATQDDRPEAAFWYRHIVRQLDNDSQLHVRNRLAFSDELQWSAETATSGVAAATGLSRAWDAYRARDWHTAWARVEGAVRIIEDHPDARLPEGLARDLLLLKARVHIASSRPDLAARAMRRAVAQDPYWRPERGTESIEFNELHTKERARLEILPAGTLSVRANQEGIRLLVGGVEQAVLGSGSFSLPLPPGDYEVTGRKSGFPDRTQQVRIRSCHVSSVVLHLEEPPTPTFEEDVLDALARPPVSNDAQLWNGLGGLTRGLAASALLVARYVEGLGDRQDALQVALYLPDRPGWAYHQEIPLDHDIRVDHLRVSAVVEGLRGSLASVVGPGPVAAR